MERMNAQSGEDQMIDTIAAELREALLALRRRQSKPGGKRVTVHISDNWSQAFIELPPEVIRIGK